MGSLIDNDLVFLKSLSDEQLDPLVRLLIYDTDFNKRHTEQLSSNKLVKNFFPKHSCYVDEIIKEIQLYGSNTIASLFRSRKGVCYKEILGDVCKKLKIKNTEDSSIENIEQNLLRTVLENAIKKMSPEQLQQFSKDANLNVNHYTAQAVISAMTAGSLPLFAMLSLAGTCSLGTLAEGAALRLIGMTGMLAAPAILVLSGIWAGFSITGPAYRVTIPACLMIACLRQEAKNAIKS